MCFVCQVKKKKVLKGKGFWVRIHLDISGNWLVYCQCKRVSAYWLVYFHSFQFTEHKYTKRVYCCDCLYENDWLLGFKFQCVDSEIKKYPWSPLTHVQNVSESSSDGFFPVRVWVKLSILSPKCCYYTFLQIRQD